jgi:hypothetical protein
MSTEFCFKFLQRAKGNHAFQRLVCDRKADNLQAADGPSPFLNLTIPPRASIMPILERATMLLPMGNLRALFAYF